MNQHVVSTTPVLARSDVGATRILTLARPANRNTLDEATLDALTVEFGIVAVEPRIHVVVLAAQGPVFSAGHDLKELTAHRTDPDDGRAYFTEIMRRCCRLMLAIARLPQPVIAAVEGVATAAGCQLVATCDLAVAGADARFCTPGVHIGLFCSTPMVALSRNLSPKHAMEMLLLGDMIDAETAHRFGLVNRVVPAGAALDAAMEMAAVIAAKSPLTVKIGKEAYHRQRSLPTGQAYDHASAVMVENMLARDAEEGIDAFLDRRQPRWTGR